MSVHNYKDEIINFVKHSSEQENCKIAIFIAGMQAQKEADLSNSTNNKQNDTGNLSK